MIFVFIVHGYFYEGLIDHYKEHTAIVWFGMVDWVQFRDFMLLI